MPLMYDTVGHVQPSSSEGGERTEESGRVGIKTASSSTALCTHADLKSHFDCSLLQELREPTGMRPTAVVFSCTHEFTTGCELACSHCCKGQRESKLPFVSAPVCISLAPDGFPAAEGKETEQCPESNCCFSPAKYCPLFPS